MAEDSRMLPRSWRSSFSKSSRRLIASARLFNLENAVTYSLRVDRLNELSIMHSLPALSHLEHALGNFSKASHLA